MRMSSIASGKDKSGCAFNTRKARSFTGVILGGKGAVPACIRGAGGPTLILRCAVTSINVKAVIRTTSSKPRGIKGLFCINLMRFDSPSSFFSTGVGEISGSVAWGVSNAGVGTTSVGVAVGVGWMIVAVGVMVKAEVGEVVGVRTVVSVNVEVGVVVVVAVIPTCIGFIDEGMDKSNLVGFGLTRESLLPYTGYTGAAVMTTASNPMLTASTVITRMMRLYRILSPVFQSG
jgi:hypothetical protein